MKARRAGFTLVEVMVAITVASVLFGICVAIYVSINRYKSRSEKLLFISEEARGITDRFARDLAGLYVGGANLADYWKAEDTEGAGEDKVCHKLTFLTATENPGKLDYCTVSYYVESGKLYREVSALMGGEPPGSPPWPAKGLLAEDVQEIEFKTEPKLDDLTAGEVPRKVTVTVSIADPGSRLRPYRRFTVTLRPGAEEH